MKYFKTEIEAKDSQFIHIDQQDIWDVLIDVRRSVHWWPKELGLRIRKVTPEIVGSEYEICLRGGKPFYARIESVEPVSLIHIKYFGEFIEGVGCWRIERHGAVCRVEYEMKVTAAGIVVAIIGRFISLSNLHSKLMKKLLINLEREVLARHGKPDP